MSTKDNQGNAPLGTSCPVCATGSAAILDRFPVEDLRTEYSRQLGIDVAAEFAPGLDEVELRQCSVCEIQFFAPLCCGSPDFYARLANQKSYYCRRRWEFEQTVPLLKITDHIVDVGCGDGHFLTLVPGVRKTGLEFNPAAVARAREKGLEVVQGDLTLLAPESADFVTLFQVLEHVAQPVDVLRQALRVLRPGGRIVIAVPNNDGFLGEVIQNPLNAPPHHSLRWREPALRFLPRVLPMTLARLEVEPLCPEQLFLYRKTVITRWVGNLLNWRVPRMRRTAATILLRKAANALTMASLQWNSALPSRPAAGQSILAIYTKL